MPRDGTATPAPDVGSVYPPTSDEQRKAGRVIVRLAFRGHECVREEETCLIDRPPRQPCIAPGHAERMKAARVVLAEAGIYPGFPA